jgi:hypothetical protein
MSTRGLRRDTRVYLDLHGRPRAIARGPEPALQHQVRDYTRPTGNPHPRDADPPVAQIGLHSRIIPEHRSGMAWHGMAWMISVIMLPSFQPEPCVSRDQISYTSYVLRTFPEMMKASVLSANIFCSGSIGWLRELQ